MTDKMFMVGASSKYRRILAHTVAEYATDNFRSNVMTTAHDECPVTYDKVEVVSKKRDAVLSDSVCKIPNVFLSKKFDFLSQFRSAQKTFI